MHLALTLGRTAECDASPEDTDRERQAGQSWIQQGKFHLLQRSQPLLGSLAERLRGHAGDSPNRPPALSLPLSWVTVDKFPTRSKS